MRIIAYGTVGGETKYIEEYAQRSNVEIFHVKEILTKDNIDLAKGYDGLSAQQSEPINDEIIYQKMHEFGIKQIGLRTVGFDAINQEYAKKYDIKVTNVPAYSPNAIAEMALSHIFYLTRNIWKNLLKQKNNDFRWDGLLAHEVRSLKVGIVGVGHIGGTLAKLLHGIGATVLGYDIKPNPQANPNVEFVDSLETLLKESDVVSLHVPATDLTTKMINQNTLALMKPTAYLVNTSRGVVVDSQAIVEALENKVIAGAGLDVFDGENGIFNHDLEGKDIPNPLLKKLLAMDNVLITPHVAFYTTNAIKNMIDIGFVGVLDILNNGESKNRVI